MSGRARSATTSSSTRYLRDCSEVFPNRSFRSASALAMRRIGIDVGGTNTDAVLLDGARVVHAVKTPTTEDVTGGIVAALVAPDPAPGHRRHQGRRDRPRHDAF